MATCAAWIAIDWWENQPDPVFVGANVPLLAWYVLAAIVLAAAMRGQSRPAPAFREALTLATGLVPMLMLIVTIAVVYFDAASVRGICIVCGAYSLIYLARGLRALTGQTQRLAPLTGVAIVVGFIWLSDALNAIPDVWNPADTGVAADGRERTAGEAVLFEQAARIDESLALVHRDSGPGPEAFFVGFAGVGDEKVFAGEIDLAARVLDSRFGFADRQVRLINDERDLERAPLATVSGLKYALRGIAARMRLDRDVLFLSISSHGSRGAVVAVSNSELPLNDLDDEELSDALRESGIQWRVVIISACYSGAFIDSLSDERTIVIAAAAADRTSFGCSNDRDLTYFGEAFYRDALPTARSLREAFDKAKAALESREHQEKVSPSEPQAFFGAKIEQKLDAAIGSSGH
jgi:Peptidase C13 family